jgi:hypothetical protein
MSRSAANSSLPTLPVDRRLPRDSMIRC